MNQFPYPFPIYNNNPQNNNIIEEINALKGKIQELEERIKILENKKITNYLKKDDSYYMI